MQIWTRQFLPENRQGIAIDAVLILLNIFIFPFFTSRVGNLFNSAFANNPGAFKTLAFLMILLLAGRLSGLYLKRFPIQARRRKGGQTAFPLYFFVLNVPVFVLTAAFVMVSVLSVSADLGIVEKTYSGQPKDSQAVALIGTFAIFALMCLEIYFIYRLAKPLDRAEKRMLAQRNWIFSWKSELLADFGLFAYMMVWQVFYNQTAALFLTFPPNITETLELKIGSVIFLFITFLMFYLSPRTVFLIEDRKYLGTWLFILLVFLSSIVRYW